MAERLGRAHLAPNPSAEQMRRPCGAPFVCVPAGTHKRTVNCSVGLAARQLPLVESVVAVDLALHSRIVSLADLCSAAACATGWPGISQARRMIEMAEPAAFHLR